MIFAQLEKLNRYVSKEQFQKINDFLKEVSPQMEERYYEINGEAIYAKVMSYPTSMKNHCKIEAHDKYIDIQFSLIGEEGIDIFDRNSLDIANKYNEKQDVTFYKETKAPYISVKNIIGYFTMIFPEEAHRPQISLNRKCEQVKKIVIKMKI